MTQECVISKYGRLIEHQTTRHVVIELIPSYVALLLRDIDGSVQIGPWWDGLELAQTLGRRTVDF